MKRHAKSDFPVSKVRRYLEPGPIVLVSSHCEGKHNIMTRGWYTVLEFSPSLVGCMISGGNHSFEMIRQSRECVINLPTTALTDIVVRIGNMTGAKIDKFAEFGLTAEKASSVEAPPIAECPPVSNVAFSTMRSLGSIISSSSRWPRRMWLRDPSTPKRFTTRATECSLSPVRP